MKFDKAAILGATGAAGVHIATELLARGVAVRAVSRSRDRLNRLVPRDAERFVADVLKPDDARRAIEGCALVFHSIGLPPAAMAQHPVAARHVAAALKSVGARCVHVSSYWGFLPLVGTPLNEDHPRQGGTPWVRWRREAEDILRDAGAAIANLPDFYGPGVESSTLQHALREAARGKRTINWIGRAETDREYAYIADAAATLVDLAHAGGAYGEHWLLPTAGPLNGRRVAEIVSAALAPSFRIRSSGSATLRLASLFDADLRAFMPLVPEYLKQIRFETTKLERLLGPQHVTSYEDGIRRTLDWLRSASPPIEPR